jgi:hypothetical protein
LQKNKLARTTVFAGFVYLAFSSDRKTATNILHICLYSTVKGTGPEKCLRVPEGNFRHTSYVSLYITGNTCKPDPPRTGSVVDGLETLVIVVGQLRRGSKREIKWPPEGWSHFVKRFTALKFIFIESASYLRGQCHQIIMAFK